MQQQNLLSLQQTQKISQTKKPIPIQPVVSFAVVNLPIGLMIKTKPKIILQIVPLSLQQIMTFIGARGEQFLW